MQSAKSRRFFHVFHNWMSTKEKQYTFLCHSSKGYPFSIVRDSRCRIYSLILALVFFSVCFFVISCVFFFFFASRILSLLHQETKAHHLCIRGVSHLHLCHSGIARVFFCFCHSFLFSRFFFPIRLPQSVVHQSTANRGEKSLLYSQNNNNNQRVLTTTENKVNVKCVV